MPAWALKLTASVMTMLAAVGSAAYVGGHLKNAAAPLHPTVASGATSFAFYSFGSGQTTHKAAGFGSLHINPSVQTASPQAALTYTSVS